MLLLVWVCDLLVGAVEVEVAMYQQQVKQWQQQQGRQG
jgi:hypothetical protein